jgi:glycosyltransferase involved in cell wall biosynthesis
VIAGQILDGRLWGRVKRRRNVHYLGDIHYDEYPAYVKASDVCIAPYVSCEKDSGGDGIKLYEYAAAGRPTVSTTGNGARGLSAFATIAHSHEGFAHAILKSIETGPSLTGLPESGFSWDERAQTMLGQFRALPANRMTRTVLR